VKAWQNGLDSLIELGKELGFSIPEWKLYPSNT
jgi:hypothetical protein